MMPLTLLGRFLEGEELSPVESLVLVFRGHFTLISTVVAPAYSPPSSVEGFLSSPASPASVAFGVHRGTGASISLVAKDAEPGFLCIGHGTSPTERCLFISFAKFFGWVFFFFI